MEGTVEMQNEIAEAYKGKEDYIFISYSHKDSEQVMPIIQQLQQDGYRVWYDDGIELGIEWGGDIATHIIGCRCFLAMMSDNYIHSENCLDEINYSRDLKQKPILVYLEKVELPPEMQMRMGRLQAINKYTYADDVFYNRLYLSKELEFCKDQKSGVESKEKESKEAKPEIVYSEDRSEATVAYKGQTVNISVREGCVGEDEIEDCIDYIDLAVENTKKMSMGHRLTIDGMFFDKYPCHAVEVSYLHDERVPACYSEKDIEGMFRDAYELRDGVFYNVHVYIGTELTDIPFL